MRFPKTLAKTEDKFSRGTAQHEYVNIVCSELVNGIGGYRMSGDLLCDLVVANERTTRVVKIRFT